MLSAAAIQFVFVCVFLSEVEEINYTINYYSIAVNQFLSYPIELLITEHQPQYQIKI